MLCIGSIALAPTWQCPVVGGPGHSVSDLRSTHRCAMGCLAVPRCHTEHRFPDARESYRRRSECEQVAFIVRDSDLVHADRRT